MQKKIIILKGLPASGKSTWAREMTIKHPNVYKRINKDDLRSMLDDGKHSKGREAFVLKIRDCIIRETIESNMSPIIDDTNFNPVHEEMIRNIANSYTPAIKVEVKNFDVDLKVCIERDAKRDKPVGEKAIKDMYKRWIKKVTTQHILEQDPSLPRAIICDLDGTLAIIGDRSPYDGSMVHLDLVNKVVKDILDRYRSTHEILLVSGRSNDFAEQTREWLLNNGINFNALIMRKSGDNRRDAIVKKEIFDLFIKDQRYIEFVIDDRNQVVEMWRDLGLQCLQVADGDF